MNRGRVVARLFLAVCAGLLVLAGCSTASEEDSTSGTGKSTSGTTSNTTPAATSASPSGTSSALPSAAKESFCRDANTAVNIMESPGTTLSEAQTNDMIKALESASNGAPNDVPADLADVIASMLADLQAPTTGLPPSFDADGNKLAQITATYCG